MPDADHDNESALILDAVNKFLEKDVAPYVREFESEDKYPQAIADKLAELGMFGATISPEYGGLGIDIKTYSKVVERVSKVWMSVSGIFNSHLIMAAAVERFATEEMKREYLPKFATGEIRGGIALTEPDAGTDLQGIRMRAVKDGDDYVIDGTKTWITNSVQGLMLAVLVKTDPEASPPHRGMSLILVPKSAGYKASKLKKLGYRGIDTGEVQFDGVRVPQSHLIGDVEGRGLQQILAGLELGRINVASRGVGVADAALQDSLVYAKERKTFGKPICEHQAIQLKLADMATRVYAARRLVEDAAIAYDTGERCDMEAGMAKLFATEAAMENAAEAMRIHGAYGYSTEYNVERYYRDAPLLCIGEGTNEMQRVIISKQLVERSS
ncbi:acyl-CoA dehydrogenase family protein [Rhodospirillales bacterium]|jgi:alkylation response protein AidB-like acyl-CoA dehydrogenase|nr:acyl-CoA dehydrogenase family protein [Rhodospirillales bacterium]